MCILKLKKHFRDFLGELEYWGLSALHLEPCCAYTLQRASWLLPIADHGVDQEDEVGFGSGCSHELDPDFFFLECRIRIFLMDGSGFFGSKDRSGSGSIANYCVG